MSGDVSPRSRNPGTPLSKSRRQNSLPDLRVVPSVPPPSAATDAANYIGGTIKAYWSVLREMRSEGFMKTMRKFLSLLKFKFLLWCKQKGDNGGVLSNGYVLIICLVQMWLWTNIDFVSKWGACLFNLPQGKRRPDVSSWRCRLIGWAVENGAVLTLCNLRTLLPHPKPIPAEGEADCSLQEATAQGIFCIARNVLISITSNLIAEQGSVYLLHLTSTKLYPQVKPFQDLYSSITPYSGKGLLDWLQGNGILQIAGGGIALGMIESFLPAGAETELTMTPFSIRNSLAHFGIFRILVDIVFYAGHRMLHVNPWLYKNIHKRHHEHFTTNLRTNYHFTALDLFIESAVPIFTALATMRSVLGIKMSRYEVHLMMTYIAWHEAGTHLGKPLPVISMFPPFSFLYNIIQGPSTAIEFHEVHHNKRHCNYGITQWIDRIMGSHMLKAQAKTGL